MRGRLEGSRSARLAVLLGLVAGLACGSEDDPVLPPDPGPPVDLSGPWQTASPRDQGFVPSQLEEAFEQARTTDRLLSLLVVRNGHMVDEEYFRGNGAEQVNDVRSVTKSVVSALVPLAISAGFVSGIDQPIGELILPETAALTQEQAQITISHLLTMTSGFEWDESTAGSYNDWVVAPDQIQYLLDRPLVDTPGSVFTYNSAAVHLLGVALEDAIGTPLSDFARDRLFEPIGIDTVVWEPVSGGRVNGGSGLDLRPRDLARLGVLMLQDGVSGSRQVLPRGWAASAMETQVPLQAEYGPLTSLSYGRLWWTAEGIRGPEALAWGFGGQFIYVVPSMNVVVVATTDWRGVGSAVGAVTRSVLDVIVNGVMRAAR